MSIECLSQTFGIPLACPKHLSRLAILCLLQAINLCPRTLVCLPRAHRMPPMHLQNVGHMHATWLKDVLIAGLVACFGNTLLFLSFFNFFLGQSVQFFLCF